MSNKLAYLFAAATLLLGCALLHRELKAHNDYSPWKKDWHGACKVAAWLTPKDRWLEYGKAPFAYKAPLLQNNGDCVANRIGGNMWLVRGTIISDAMGLNNAPPHFFEAYVIEDRNANEPAVQAYGSQYLPCAFRVDGVVSFPAFVSSGCRHGAKLMRFGAFPGHRTSASGR